MRPVTDIMAEEAIRRLGHYADGAAAAEIIRELIAERQDLRRYRHVERGTFYQVVGDGLWIDHDVEGEDMMDLALRQRGALGLFTVENAIPVSGYEAGKLQCARAAQVYEPLVIYRAEIDRSWWARPTEEFYRRFERAA